MFRTLLLVLAFSSAVCKGKEDPAECEGERHCLRREASAATGRGSRYHACAAAFTLASTSVALLLLARMNRRN